MLGKQKIMAIRGGKIDSTVSGQSLVVSLVNSTPANVFCHNKNGCQKKKYE